MLDGVISRTDSEGQLLDPKAKERNINPRSRQKDSRELAITNGVYECEEQVEISYSRYKNNRSGQ